MGLHYIQNITSTTLGQIQVFFQMEKFSVKNAVTVFVKFLCLVLIEMYYTK